MKYKTYRNTAELCAAWALAEPGAAGKLSSSGSFYGLELFSYGTRVAQITRDAAGGLVGLFTSNSYSTTTSAFVSSAKHAFKAAHPAGLCFSVPGAAIDHAAALEHFEKNAREDLASVEKARVPDAWRKRAKRQVAKADAYAAAFGVPWAWKGRDVDSVLSRKEREMKGGANER